MVFSIALIFVMSSSTLILICSAKTNCYRKCLRKCFYAMRVRCVCVCVDESENYLLKRIKYQIIRTLKLLSKTSQLRKHIFFHTTETTTVVTTNCKNVVPFKRWTLLTFEDDIFAIHYIKICQKWTYTMKNIVWDYSYINQTLLCCLCIIHTLEEKWALLFRIIWHFKQRVKQNNTFFVYFSLFVLNTVSFANWNNIKSEYSIPFYSLSSQRELICFKHSLLLLFFSWKNKKRWCTYSSTRILIKTKREKIRIGGGCESYWRSVNTQNKQKKRTHKTRGRWQPFTRIVLIFWGSALELMLFLWRHLYSICCLFVLLWTLRTNSTWELSSHVERNILPKRSAKHDWIVRVECWEGSKSKLNFVNQSFCETLRTVIFVLFIRHSNYSAFLQRHIKTLFFCWNF
jgi:hypothetical protein